MEHSKAIESSLVLDGEKGFCLDALGLGAVVLSTTCDSASVEALAVAPVSERGATRVRQLGVWNMIVEYCSERAALVPEDRRRFMKLRLTPGRRYEVHGVSVFDQMVFVLVVDDIDTDAFCLAAAFRVVDGSIPPGWVCTVSEGLVPLVLGPPFLAASLERYNAFVDRDDQEQLDDFWRYLDSRARRSVGDGTDE